MQRVVVTERYLVSVVVSIQQQYMVRKQILEKNVKKHSMEISRKIK